METSRDDVGIAIRSAFIKKGAQQRFSLFALAVLSILLIFLDTIESKPLNNARSVIKDIIYRSASLTSYPTKSFSNFYSSIEKHITLHKKYKILLEENKKLKNNFSDKEFLELENTQLRKLIDEQAQSSLNLLSARVLLDKQSPYLNSLIVNTGSNQKVKNGLAVLDGKNFVGRIVDVNYFSSRVLLITDLNSKIPVVVEPSGTQAILSGRGINELTLQYLPENHKIKEGDKIYTSGKEGFFSSGIPIGEVVINEDDFNVLLFSDLSQITFLNISLGQLNIN